MVSGLMDNGSIGLKAPRSHSSLPRPMLVIGLTENRNCDPELYRRMLPGPLSLANVVGGAILQPRTGANPKLGTNEPAPEMLIRLRILSHKWYPIDDFSHFSNRPPLSLEISVE